MSVTLSTPPVADAAPTPLPSRFRTPRGGRGRGRSARATPYLMMVPAIVLFVAFFVIPLAYAVFLSFQTRSVAGGSAYGRREQVFAGLDNYAAALSNPELLASFGRLAVYGVVVVPLTLLLALAFALLLDHPRTTLASPSRIAILLPYAVPGVIASLLWGFLYLPSTTPFNAVTGIFGIPPTDFLGYPEVFGSLANIAIWGHVGFNMIIMFTALRAVPAEIYDSARVDGCSEWQIAWKIKIPLIAPALVLSGLFAFIGTLQVYSEPTILRTLTSSISSTFFPLMSIYRDAFHTDNVYGAAATSVVLAIGTLVVSLLVLKFFQRRAFTE